MNKQIKLFEGQEVKVKTDEGVTLINLVHVAKCCGIIKKKNNIDYIRWNGKGGVVEKITNLSSEVSELKIQDEITYILEEIENADDRNSIYMSTWLAKRLAVECHSDKASKFKNWLVTLDEAREKGQLVQQINDEKVLQNMQLMAQNMQFMSKAMEGIQVFVQDSIQAKDKQIDDIAELVGLRSRNVYTLTGALKKTLTEKYHLYSVNANMEVYKKAKNKVFKEFNVHKWEDIPAGKYNKVQAFIEECV